MITVYLTRHAQSEANAMDTTEIYDSALSAAGLAAARTDGPLLRAAVGNVHAVLTSPLRRAVQTAATVYPDVAALYAVSLLTEYCATPDCTGRPADEIQAEEPRVDTLHLLAGNDDGTDDAWWNDPFRRDRVTRVRKFAEFVATTFIPGDIIHAFSHGGFIERITGRQPENLQTYKVFLNPSTLVFTPSWRALRPLAIR